MLSTRDPASMTEDERLREIAGLLATGFLRARRDRRRHAISPQPDANIPLEPPRNGLELSTATRLSVTSG